MTPFPFVVLYNSWVGDVCAYWGKVSIVCVVTCNVSGCSNSICFACCNRIRGSHFLQRMCTHFQWVMCQLTDSNIQVDNYFERENQIDRFQCATWFHLIHITFHSNIIWRKSVHVGDVYGINCSGKSVHVGDVYGINCSINACCNIILKSRMGINVCN